MVFLGHRLKILWGKAQAGIPLAAQKAGGSELPPVPGLPGGELISPLPCCFCLERLGGVAREIEMMVGVREM